MKKNRSDNSKRRKRDVEGNYTANPMWTNRRVYGVRDSALPAFSSSSNRLTTSGFTYDAAGNLTKDSSNPTAHTYQWDGEERVSSVDSGATWGFTYNAVGDRAQWAYTGGAEQHLFDAAGNWLGVAGAYSLVPFGNHYLLVYTSSDTMFNHVNHLSSTTLRTSHSRTPLEDMLFYPWGDVWKSWGSGGYNFAALPYRDLSTTTDLTASRVSSPNLGRWLTPDPAGQDVADSTDPQTWNMYAYVRNSPTTNLDPDGEDYYLLGGGACLNVPDPCDNQGYLLDENGSRQVITDQQVLNGEVGVTWGANGTASTITTDQGTFEVQFFDNLPTSIDVNSAPGSALAAVGVNFGIGMYNTVADTGNSFIRNLTFGQYSLNLPNVPGGLSNAAVSGQALAILLPAIVPGGEEPTPGQLAQAEQVLLRDGRGAVAKAIRTLERQILEHEEKIQQATGYTSSMEAEVRNFKGLIQAYKQVLGR